MFVKLLRWSEKAGTNRGVNKSVLLLWLGCLLTSAVCVLCVSCLWDAAHLNVPPQLSLLYLTEMNGGQGWATHSSPQSQTTKKTTCNRKNTWIHSDVYVQLMCLFFTCSQFRSQKLFTIWAKLSSTRTRYVLHDKQQFLHK